MMASIRSFLSRSSGTLIEDAAGVASLAVMLIAALHLSGSF